MEQWQLDFEWLRIQHYIKDSFKYEKLPDLNAVLMLIGVQELGKVKQSWTKEEKQNLMHIAVCTLLSQEGYYAFEGLDHEGWPHFIALKPIDQQGVKNQENLLKSTIIRYFDLSKT